MGIFDRDYYYQRGNPQWGQSPHAEQPLRDTGAATGRSLAVDHQLRRFVLAGLLAGARVSFSSVSASLYHKRCAPVRVSRMPTLRSRRHRASIRFRLLPANLIGRFYIWQLVTYQFIHGDFPYSVQHVRALHDRPFRRTTNRLARVLLLHSLGGIFAGLTNLLSHMFTDMPTIGDPVRSAPSSRPLV